jgi:exodeoxyribonuclease V alpha subunit
MKANNTHAEHSGFAAEFLAQSFFSHSDRWLAELMSGGRGGLIGVAAATLSCLLRQGHVFLDLRQPPKGEGMKDDTPDQWPSLAEWRSALSGADAVGEPGSPKPMILTPAGKLYLQRYWFYEYEVSRRLKQWGQVDLADIDPVIEQRVSELFGDANGQKAAAKNALRRPFSVIGGGPGTGKTTTVLKILVVLLEENPNLEIRLAAPTGKAAARMQESLRDGLPRVTCSESVRTRLEGIEASTIHRLLGSVAGSVFFRHRASNPLAADLVILDEASMVDLPLMAKLFDALSPRARLIMLGDQDQLASVEAGSVLAGIVEASATVGEAANAPLDGAVSFLWQNYRFGNESPIFRLCQAARTGDADQFTSLRREMGWKDGVSADQLKEELRETVLAGFGDLLRETSPEGALTRLGQFQILTALRSGPWGRERVNQWVEEILREENLIPVRSSFYSCRPIMVTENDYSNRLFNGDLGILFVDTQGDLMAWFRREDGSLRKISPRRLPDVEPAYAMTVHKAQGSEFDRVLLLLPGRDNPVLSRELVYTAISRARQQVEIWADEEVMRAAIARKVSRGSGLADMLGTT